MSVAIDAKGPCALVDSADGVKFDEYRGGGGVIRPGKDPGLGGHGVGEAEVGGVGHANVLRGAVEVEGEADLSIGEGGRTNRGAVVAADIVQRVAFGGPPTHDTGWRGVAGRW